MDRRKAISTLAAAALLLSTESARAGAAEESGAELFPLSAVRLLEGPFQQAQEVDRKYLLQLDADRLMAYLRENAGLKPVKTHYGGWDNEGASTVGHYLSACSHMWAATGDVQIKQRIDYLVAQMASALAHPEYGPILRNLVRDLDEETAGSGTDAPTT